MRSVSLYTYELPTTGSLSFADYFSDPYTLYTAHIAEATQARANLRALLKESKHSNGDKDYLRLVKVTLEEYLPNLYSVIACASHGELVQKQLPVFSWRTTLSANLFNTSPRLSVPSLPSELAFTLFTYAFALSNLAELNVTALGDYERARGISDVERKARDEKLGFAVTLLCKAAGVFAHVSEDVLVNADNTPGWMEGIERPPELSKEVASALSKLSLVAAQSLAVRKLLTKAAYDSTITPGPPLPKSHPSPALLAKLHLEAATLSSSALSLARIPGSSKARLKSPSARPKLHFSLGRDKDKPKDAVDGEGDESKGRGEKEKDDMEVAGDFLRFVGEIGAFHAALGRKWLGVSAGEADISSKGGEAVGYLLWAKKELEELKEGGKGGGKEEGKEGRKERKGRLSEEIESASTFLRHYKKLNDSLSYKPIPSQSELQANIPAGILAVNIRPFIPPTPAFGPGSVEYMRKQEEDPELAELEGRSDTASPRTGQSYLGAGSYF
ncbi:hypothetical protein OF83DRAFT_1062492 [Amylostereum chailletii]|nr:hypothetical protein OF83DRAFT_1062492 [Amylostereum chailletii]